MTVGESVAEPVRALLPHLDATARRERVAGLLAEVGLEESLAGRYPHQLSGGQLQRAVIARALVVDPRLVVCDEPVTALDVSIQGQVVNLIARIRRERDLACLFISHNLAVIARLASRALVMYRGRIVETAASRELVLSPLHPYTRLLMDSVPGADPVRARRLLTRRNLVSVSTREPASNGCAFVTRCPYAVDRCRTLQPPLREFGHARQVACHRADEWRDGLPTAGD
jgi:oligopeptide/dipeptide ABC transporter ATP-binding protein